MNRFNLQLISLLVLDLLSVNLPFLWIFHSEWRYHARKTAGILLGYLIMACGLFLFVPFSYKSKVSGRSLYPVPF